MLKRKNPDNFQSGTMGPPAKRQTLCDITNNLISDPKCTIVPRSPIKLETAIVAANVVFEFKGSEYKVCPFKRYVMLQEVNQLMCDRPSFCIQS